MLRQEHACRHTALIQGHRQVLVLGSIDGRVHEQEDWRLIEVADLHGSRGECCWRAPALVREASAAL